MMTTQRDHEAVMRRLLGQVDFDVKTYGRESVQAQTSLQTCVRYAERHGIHVVVDRAKVTPC